MSTSTPLPVNRRRFVDEAGNPIVPGNQLGEGGEGWVYLVDGQPGSVMKIWRPGKTPQDAEIKISHLMRNPVRPDPRDTWRITWPQHLVKENGVAVGYTMPMLDRSWEPIVKYYNLKAAEGTEAEQGRELRIDDRVRMARNIALSFHAVHAAGYVIGDVNEKNVEVNRQNDIALVDCDSYGFTDRATGRTFSNNMGRPEFQAPEAQGNFENRTQDHDLFGLAVIIFLLLTGYHPHTVTGQPAQDYNTHGARIGAWLFPPANLNSTTTREYSAAWDRLTFRQKELFRRCFDRAYAGQPRPTPEEWVEALQELPEERPSPQPQPQPPPQPQPQPQPQPRSRPQPQPTATPPAGPSVFGGLVARLSIRHILLTGIVNPVVALLVLVLYRRRGHTGFVRAFGAAVLLTVIFLITAFFLTLGGTHGWWWLLSPVAALVLLLVIARKPRISREAITVVALLWIGWACLNVVMFWVEDYNGGGTVAPAPAVASVGDGSGSSAEPTAFPFAAVVPTDTPPPPTETPIPTNTPVPVGNSGGGTGAAALGPPTFSLSKSSAIANDIVIIQGHGFTADTTIPVANFTIGGAPLDVTGTNAQNGMVPTDGNGQFVTEARLWPVALAGAAGGDPSGATYWTVMVQDSQGAAVESGITILVPTVTVSSETAGPRDFITVSGENWPLSTRDREFQVNISVDGNEYPVTIDHNGRFALDVQLSTDIPLGAHHDVVAVLSEHNGHIEAATKFNTLTPGITLSPAMASPGDTITVALVNMPLYSLVDEVSMSGINLLGNLNLSTDREGNAVIDGILVPSVEAGFYEVRVTVSGDTVTGQLAVLENPATPTPPPYPDPVLLEQRGSLPGQLARAPRVNQLVSGCFVGSEPRQKHWAYLADRPSTTLESARNPIILEFHKSTSQEDLRGLIPGKCYYVGPVKYHTDETAYWCPGTVYGTNCHEDKLGRSFPYYDTGGTLREITEVPAFGN